MSFYLETALKNRKQGTTHKRFFESLRGKPFWYSWDKDKHKLEYERTAGRCCWNHIIGVPVKEYPRPLYDFQKLILDAVERYRLLWLLKSRGNGSSELFLRYMAYLATVRAQEPEHAPLLANSQMCIVTGPRLELAVSLITRMKKLFEPHGIQFDSKETVVEFPLTNIRVEAFPSSNIASMRGLPNVSAIVADEFSFLPIPSQAREALAVCSGYLAKNRNIIIVFMSTANKPDDPFMELGEPGSMFYPLRLDYRYGLDRIYSRQEIEQARRSYSFAREFELQPLGQEGDLLSQLSIDRAIRDDYDPSDINPSMPHSIGIDIGWGQTSKTAWVVTRLNREKGRVEMMHATQRLQVPFQDAVAYGYNLLTAYGGAESNVKVWADQSSPEYIAGLKTMIGEKPTNYAQAVKEWKDWGYTEQYQLVRKMTVHGVSFNTEARRMLGHVVALHDGSKIAIHPLFQDLITACRTARSDDALGLLKTEMVNADLMDAYRLSLNNWQIQQQQKQQSNDV